MAFEMTAQQLQAAKDSMDGISPLSYLHFIVFFVAALAVIWTAVNFRKVVNKVSKNEMSFNEILITVVGLVFVLIFGGMLIF